jgi:hypothetical protein
MDWFTLETSTKLLDSHPDSLKPQTNSWSDEKSWQVLTRTWKTGMLTPIHQRTGYGFIRASKLAMAKRIDVSAVPSDKEKIDGHAPTWKMQIFQDG